MAVGGTVKVVTGGLGQEPESREYAKIWNVRVKKPHFILYG